MACGSGSPLTLAKTKITKSSRWNLCVSSAYSNSIGRIPEGCVYADRAVAAIEDTEVMSCSSFLGCFAKVVKGNKNVHLNIELAGSSIFFLTKYIF